MTTKQHSTSEETWRSSKAHETICEAAESIANQYCSEDDTYNLEVRRLTVAFSDVVDQRISPAGAAPVVDELTVYADGFCARCSELAYPLTRALEKTGVPTGADNWQQTYGPNKVRALADLETCLRRLLFALEQGKPEEIKERITRANHYIEFHAEVRRRLTALAQERNADSAAATAAPVGHCSMTLLGYERAITIEWDKHNARRHDLIEAKRSRSLSDEEASELRELQWLAGIKRELGSGLCPVAASSSSARVAAEEILKVCAEYCSQLPRAKEIQAIVERVCFSTDER